MVPLYNQTLGSLQLQSTAPMEGMIPEFRNITDRFNNRHPDEVPGIIHRRVRSRAPFDPFGLSYVPNYSGMLQRRLLRSPSQTLVLSFLSLFSGNSLPFSVVPQSAPPRLAVAGKHRPLSQLHPEVSRTYTGVEEFSCTLLVTFFSNASSIAFWPPAASHWLLPQATRQ